LSNCLAGIGLRHSDGAFEFMSSDVTDC
jgi:hypothetical protein